VGGHNQLLRQARQQETCDCYPVPSGQDPSVLSSSAVWHRGSAMANASMRLTWPGRCADSQTRIGRHRGGSFPSSSSPCYICAGEGRVHAIKTNMRAAWPRRSPQPQRQPEMTAARRVPGPRARGARRPRRTAPTRLPAGRAAGISASSPAVRAAVSHAPCEALAVGTSTSSGLLGEETKWRAEFCRF